MSLKKLQYQLELLIEQINLAYSFDYQQAISLRIIHTPLGFYLAASFMERICRLDIIKVDKIKLMLNQLARTYKSSLRLREDSVGNECAQQLAGYFTKQLTVFSLPILVTGTIFQQKAWEILSTIPYGSTISYQQQATALRQPKAFRAVGSANSKNPISIIIPCHRVIGSDGTLTGYASGLTIKKQLLTLEQS